MSKKRKYQRQSATNPAQIRATGTTGPLRVPVVIDNGDGTPTIVMLTKEEYEKLQQRKASRIKAEAEV
jgi:hypothetical protein